MIVDHTNEPGQKSFVKEINERPCNVRRLKGRQKDRRWRVRGNDQGGVESPETYNLGGLESET